METEETLDFINPNHVVSVEFVDSSKYMPDYKRNEEDGCWYLGLKKRRFWFDSYDDVVGVYGIGERNDCPFFIEDGVLYKKAKVKIRMINNTSLIIYFKTKTEALVFIHTHPGLLNVELITL